MSQESPLQQGKPPWTGMGLAVFVVGLLILVTSGLCTASLIVQIPPFALVFLLGGALPMAAGVLVMRSALKARRHPAAPTKPTHKDTSLKQGEPPRRPPVNIPPLVIGLLVLALPGYFMVPTLVESFDLISRIRLNATGIVTVAFWSPFLVLGGVPMALGVWLVYSALKPPPPRLSSVL